MKISDKGLMFIAKYETADGQPNLKAIKSPEQSNKGQIKYEIGWGHNSDKYFSVDADTEITYEKAIDLLKHDVMEAEFAVQSWIKKHHLGLQFTQNEYDALISAAYNGVPFYTDNTGLSKALIADDTKAIIYEWQRWVYMTVNGKKVKAKGLIKRRADEVDLFLKGDYERNY